MTMTDQTLAEAVAEEAAAAVAAEAVIIPDAILSNARELDDMRSALKTMEKREKVLREAVLGYLTSIGEDAAVTGNVAISLSHSTRTGVDTKRLKALFPKVHAAVKTSTPVTQVRVKIKG